MLPRTLNETFMMAQSAGIDSGMFMHFSNVYANW